MKHSVPDALLQKNASALRAHAAYRKSTLDEFAMVLVDRNLANFEGDKALEEIQPLLTDFNKRRKDRNAYNDQQLQDYVRDGAALREKMMQIAAAIGASHAANEACEEARNPKDILC